MATPEDRFNARLKWHKWFAWHPVRMTHDAVELRWLENVCRRGERDDFNEGWIWIYADSIDAVADILKQ